MNIFKGFAKFAVCLLAGLITINWVLALAVLFSAFTSLVVAVIAAIGAALASIVVGFKIKFFGMHERMSVFVAACIAIGPVAICSQDIKDFASGMGGKHLKGVSVAEAVKDKKASVLYLNDAVVTTGYRGTHKYTPTGTSRSTGHYSYYYSVLPIADTKEDLIMPGGQYNRERPVRIWAVRVSTEPGAPVLAQDSEGRLTSRGTDPDGNVYPVAGIRPARDRKFFLKAIHDARVSYGLESVDNPVMIQVSTNPSATLMEHLHSAILAVKYFNTGWIILVIMTAMIMFFVKLKKKDNTEKTQ